MHLGLRGRLILGTTALVVLFTVTVVAVLAVQLDGFVAERIARRVADGRASLLAAIAQQRTTLGQETNFLARSPILIALASIPGVDQATLEGGFDEIQSDFRVAEVALASPDGKVRGRRGALFEIGSQLTGQPGMAAALEGSTSVHVWTHQNTLLLVAVAPIIRDDTITAILIRGERVDDRFAAELGGLVGRDVLLTHAGRVHGYSDRPEASTRIDLWMLAKTSHGTVPANGRPSEIKINGELRPGLALQFSPDAGVAFLPHDVGALLRLRDNAMLLLLGIGLAVTLIGVWFATSSARRLTRPMHRLMTATRRIQDGDLDARVDVESSDEIGRLGHSFNSMAATMQQLVVDVTDKAARAEAANRAKDGFLMSVSHELRTPLTGIQSTAELLQQFGDDASSAERAEFLDTILTEAERLGRRIGDALEYATLASDRTEWTMSRLDLGELCRQTCARLDSLQTLKAVTYSVDTPAPATLQGDRERIAEAVYHLLHNAWQWSPAGGRIEVVVRSASAELAIDVLDRGPGIPASEQERIFDRFAQGGDVLVDKPQGIGIGLVIAREVALAHGGGVEYRDRQNGGACFTLRLGLADRPIDELAASSNPATTPATG